MKQTPLVGKQVQCPRSFSGKDDGICTINDLCGLPDNVTPNQWWRFIAPIGLHGGIVHFIFNMLVQIQIGFSMERDIGWWRIGLIYLISGIFGFIFGANFAPEISGKFLLS
jgi:membrane associated rhomboid family serine protease